MFLKVRLNNTYKGLPLFFISAQFKIILQISTMLVKSAKFIASYGQQTEMPDDKNLEIAFIGRSNVGKS